MTASLSNQQSILKEVYAKMAIPPQFIKGRQKQEDPKAQARKKMAAAKLAKLKGQTVKDTDRDGK
ncbi:hypothetical protein [Streptomyces sp. NPDC048720]|uniref:hypothetical protein n=1 Tax=Streptomyces sp. NPDC048720 TaxID=3365588 RepID=UPI00371808F7